MKQPKDNNDGVLFSTKEIVYRSIWALILVVFFLYIIQVLFSNISYSFIVKTIFSIAIIYGGLDELKYAVFYTDFIKLYYPLNPIKKDIVIEYSNISEIRISIEGTRYGRYFKIYYTMQNKNRKASFSFHNRKGKEELLKVTKERGVRTTEVISHLPYEKKTL